MCARMEQMSLLHGQNFIVYNKPSEMPSKLSGKLIRTLLQRAN